MYPSGAVSRIEKCWPAMYGVGCESESRYVLIRGVSGRISATVATCHPPTRGKPTRSVALVALLEPGIAAVVVAALLPEPGFVVVPEAQTGYPFGALPDVEVRHQHPGWAAVL